MDHQYRSKPQPQPQPQPQPKVFQLLFERGQELTNAIQRARELVNRIDDRFHLLIVNTNYFRIGGKTRTQLLSTVNQIYEDYPLCMSNRLDYMSNRLRQTGNVLLGFKDFPMN